MPPATKLRPAWNRLLTYKRILFVLLIPLCALLTALASWFPQAVERVYSRGIYRGLRAVVGRLTSLLPLSVAELTLYAVLLGVLFLLVRALVRRIRKTPPRRRAHPVLWWASTLLCAAGVVYGLFVLTCGLNYHRPSFAQQSGLVVRESSTQELAALYAQLAGEANTLRALVPEDEHGVMSLGTDSAYQLAAQAPAAYTLLAERYEVFGGYTPRPKPVLSSRLMSWCDITGIYMPFVFFEANINVDVTAYVIPATMMHELAHSKGFMQEEEANFIAYLACREMEDPRFAYSGTMLALVQSGNALYRADADLFREVYATLDDGVRRDMAANSAYWKQFESPVAEVAQAMNNTYLKANGQSDGVASYGRVVDLLLADYRQRHGLE